MKALRKDGSLKAARGASNRTMTADDFAVKFEAQKRVEEKAVLPKVGKLHGVSNEFDCLVNELGGYIEKIHGKLDIIFPSDGLRADMPRNVENSEDWLDEMDAIGANLRAVLSSAASAYGRLADLI